MNNGELTHRFHFTLGPVQGFVAEARRTRDFWAGSFLLSYLTACAMKKTKDLDGKIISPALEIKEGGKTITDPLLARIRSGNADGPCVATLPNHFEAEVAANFATEIFTDGMTRAESVADAVRKEWKRIADAVWNLDLKGIDGPAKELLWDTQIDNFWDTVWVITKGEAPAALAMRKNWRSYMPPTQYGDKCTMMGEWQELSGVKAPGAQGQKEFWESVRKGKGLDLREGERLCAIAYVKRRFVHVWDRLEGHEGWKLPPSVPSTSYMAAVHWLEKLIGSEPDNGKVADLCNTARKAHALGEKMLRIHCISTALAGSGLDGCIADIDGRLLFDNELRQLKESKKEKGGEITRQQATAIRDARSALIESIRQTQPDFPKEPSPFYAILFMDGDNLGDTIRDLGEGGTRELSEDLAKFTRKVAGTGKKDGTVYRHNGFLIYAGGDDVLAILPLEDAMACASELRRDYLSSFSDKLKSGGNVSISAAITYAHMKLPLTAILKDTFRLLVDVAKDGTGRDAIACRVWKPGGEQLTWALPWNIPEEQKGGRSIAQATDMLALVDEMKKRAEKKSDVGYSSKLLYGFREILKMVIPDEIPEKDDDIRNLAANIKALELDKLLETAYLSSGLLDGWDDKEEGMDKLAYVQKQIVKLMPLMRVYDKQGAWNGLYSSDGALLLRFLAQKGGER